ncbi:DUF1343 domain-containing protein [Candidatus Sumerlaeota bacterium]|nr:DUF1343 domain-containing protein [Candidatus Sumerlaeota bacterium]
MESRTPHSNSALPWIWRGAAMLAAVLAFSSCAARKSPPANKAETQQPIVSPVVELTPDLVRALKHENAFRLGMEIEQGRDWADLRFQRVALLVNELSFDQKGIGSVEALSHESQFTLFKVIIADADRAMGSNCLREAVEALPEDRVVRLANHPEALNDRVLENSSAILWDIPLTGARFDEEVALLCRVLELAVRNDMKVIITDRPSLVPVMQSEGPTSDRDAIGSETAYFPIPLFPAMTAGELGKLINQEFAIQADLVVVPMENWNRKDANGWLAGSRLAEQCLAGTGTLTDPTMVKLQSAVTLINGGNEDSGGVVRAGLARESSGPGLALTFKGAENATAVRSALEGLEMSGVVIANADVATPNRLALQVTNSDQISPVELSLQVFYAMAQAKLKVPDTATAMYGNKLVAHGLARGMTPDQIRRRWSITQEARDWPDRRNAHLLYPAEQ